MPHVTFLHPKGTSGTVVRNTTLLDAAKELGFPLNHDCGGNASCTTCRVEVQSGESICRRSISKNRICWTAKRSASLGIGSGVRLRSWATLW